MEFLLDTLKNFLNKTGLSATTADWLSIILLVLGALIVVFIIDFIIRIIIRVIFSKIAQRSKTNLDDIMIVHKVPRNIAHIVPLFIAYEIIPNIFFEHIVWQNTIKKFILVLGIVFSVWGLRSVFGSIKTYFKSVERLKDKPIDSYIQVIMIFVWLTGVFATFAVVTGISFLEFIAGLGTVSAVVILVFKDTILGFVASIQVSVNDMVRIGDWITFQKYGADGDVIEINLATVKVRNFDHTITTIPTYALISDSFKNWRGMTESNGRRIKRALNIRMASIRLLNSNDLENLSKIELIREYIANKSSDITSYNSDNEVDKSLLINGRNLTNIGVFRKYIESYVENHSAINKDLMVMARQLQPGDNGLPIEIYAFSSEKRWQNYEYIIADIFDHIIAASSTFDLEIYEHKF
ncbi:MAG: Miniconductance mechanosensitive channel YbdG [Formosa sp. Hel3_A1_48]|nr:MAG: Miniconductance mechanosensitive channel YbdG [Formosa sp. Hel3_A1_48]